MKKNVHDREWRLPHCKGTHSYRQHPKKEPIQDDIVGEACSLFPPATFDDPSKRFQIGLVHGKQSTRFFAEVEVAAVGLTSGSTTLMQMGVQERGPQVI